MKIAGQTLLARLDPATFTAALWLFLSEAGTWRYVLASPSVGQTGSRPLYEAVDNASTTLGLNESTISLQDIAIVGDSDLTIRLLRLATRVQPPMEVRFARNTIQGHYIEDAYIYKL